MCFRCCCCCRCRLCKDTHLDNNLCTQEFCKTVNNRMEWNNKVMKIMQQFALLVGRLNFVSTSFNYNIIHVSCNIHYECKSRGFYHTLYGCEYDDAETVCWLNHPSAYQYNVYGSTHHNVTHTRTHPNTHVRWRNRVLVLSSKTMDLIDDDTIWPLI